MDAFLFIDGIEGPVIAEGLEGSFEILSFNHAAHRGKGGSGGQHYGKIELSSFNVVRMLDKATPLLWDMCFKNEPRPVTLKLSRSASDDSGAQEVFMSYILDKARISSINVSGGTGSQAVENITFLYDKIDWDYAGTDGHSAAAYDLNTVTSG